MPVATATTSELATLSSWRSYPTDRPDELRATLAQALGVRGVVREKRRVYMVHSGSGAGRWDDQVNRGSICKSFHTDLFLAISGLSSL